MKTSPYTYAKAKEIETKINRLLSNRGSLKFVNPPKAQREYVTPMEFNLTINPRWAWSIGDIHTNPVSVIISIVAQFFDSYQEETYNLDYDDTAVLTVTYTWKDRDPNDRSKIVTNRSNYKIIIHLPSGMPGDRTSSVNKEAIKRGLKPRKRKMDESTFENLKEDIIADLDSVQDEIEYAYDYLRQAHKTLQKLEGYSPKIREYVSGMSKFGESLELWHDRVETFINDILPNVKYLPKETDPKPY